jgi:sugar phosphate isomerase/epimerase
MKLGYTTWGMPELAIDDAIRHIVQLGYDGIEIAVGPGWSTALSNLDRAERQRIKQLLADAGLTLSAIAGHASLLEADPEAHAQNVARLHAAIDFAVEWTQGDEPPFVNTLSGGRSADWDQYHELFAERLAKSAEYAQSRGVTLAMEPHVDGLVDMPDRMIKIMEMVQAPALKVNFDISHFDIHGMSIEESVRALAPYTVHTHVKDQRGRYPNYEFLTPGEGDFDYVTYLKTMRAYGYDGYINAEVSKMRQAKPDYDPYEAATLSYVTLARAFEEAGIER